MAFNAYAEVVSYDLCMFLAAADMMWHLIQASIIYERRTHQLVASAL